jgi:esterase/lipase superfamily enzyme
MSDTAIDTLARQGSRPELSTAEPAAIQRAEHRWHSPSLDREMEIIVFGHAGTRMLVFPTSEGRCFDWEGFGLVEAVADHLRSGAIQLICADSIDSESWYAKGNPPAARFARHAQYDAYLRDEVVPFSERLNPGSALIVGGASFGAYHAVTFALRYPWLVTRAIGMSGLYDIRRFVDGYEGSEVDAYNPVALVDQETDPERLEQIRALDIVLAVGDEPLRASNRRLSELLEQREIAHRHDVSDAWTHDWSSWAQMLRLYLE